MALPSRGGVVASRTLSYLLAKPHTWSFLQPSSEVAAAGSPVKVLFVWEVVQRLQKCLHPICNGSCNEEAVTISIIISINYIYIFSYSYAISGIFCVGREGGSSMKHSQNKGAICKIKLKEKNNFPCIFPCVVLIALRKRGKLLSSVPIKPSPATSEW